MDRPCFVKMEYDLDVINAIKRGQTSHIKNSLSPKKSLKILITYADK